MERGPLSLQQVRQEQQAAAAVRQIVQPDADGRRGRVQLLQIGHAGVPKFRCAVEQVPFPIAVQREHLPQAVFARAALRAQGRLDVPLRQTQGEPHQIFPAATQRHRDLLQFGFPLLELAPRLLLDPKTAQPFLIGEDGERAADHIPAAVLRHGQHAFG